MADYSDYEAEERGRQLGGGWISWAVILIVIAVGAAFLSAPSNYVVEMPGPVYDTLGTADVDGDTIPLVDIPMEQTYPTTGSLDMLTVSTVGNRTSRVPWLRVAQAWLDKTQAIVPLDDVYPEGRTTAEQLELGQAQMTASQQEAIAAALTVLGEKYTTAVTVVATTAGGPAVDIVLPGDVIAALNGTPVTDTDQVRDLLETNGTAAPATVSVVRAGVAQDLVVTPAAGDDGPVLGVQITTTYDFPFDVTVQLDDVGGPSAGQIFALAIIDKLTPGPLTGGRNFAGTGTITADGKVGAIGGIRQKLYGAEREGADYFLAPAANCDEVVGHIPDGLEVFAVTTLADSLTVMNTIATGSSTAFLPRCTS